MRSGPAEVFSLLRSVAGDLGIGLGDISWHLVGLALHDPSSFMRIGGCYVLRQQSLHLQSILHGGILDRAVNLTWKI